jgi:hypothetical protein
LIIRQPKGPAHGPKVCWKEPGPADPEWQTLILSAGWNGFVYRSKRFIQIPVLLV